MNFPQVIVNNKEYTIIKNIGDNYAILDENMQNGHFGKMVFFVKQMGNNFYAAPELYNFNNKMFNKNFEMFENNKNYAELMDSNGHYFNATPFVEIINKINRKKKLSKLLSK